MSTSEEPVAKRRKFSLNFFKDTVKIVVGKGDEKVEIDVPKARLCEVSEFFVAGCSDRWASGREGVIKLEEDNPKIFSIFLAWAFGGSIESSEDYVVVDDTETEFANSTWRDRHYQLLRCFLLGERLLAFEFKNSVMDLIIESQNALSEKFKVTGYSASNGILLVYQNTPTNSPLRRFLVETVISRKVIIAKKCSPDDTYATFQYYEDFYSDVIACLRMAMSNGGRKRDPFDKPSCTFHEHPGEPAGYSCTKTKTKHEYSVP